MSSNKWSFLWIYTYLAVLTVFIIKYYVYPKPTVRDLPVTFVGGVKYSGFAVIQELLDLQNDVHCGKETFVLPAAMQQIEDMVKEHRWKRLTPAGLTREMMNDTTALFVHEILKGSALVDGKGDATRLCNSDPEMLHYMTWLSTLFPNAKFVNVVRDGRVVAERLTSDNKTEDRVDNVLTALQTWNNETRDVWTNCNALGKERCMTIRYEDVVSRPRDEVRQLFKFLGLRSTIGTVTIDLVDITITEPKTEQYRTRTEAAQDLLTNSLIETLESAPMLATLGYDKDSKKQNEKI